MVFELAHKCEGAKLEILAPQSGVWLYMHAVEEAKPQKAAEQAARAGLWAHEVRKPLARERPGGPTARVAPRMDATELERWRLRAEQEADGFTGPFLRLLEQGYRAVRRCHGSACAERVQREVVDFVLKDGLVCRRLRRPGSEEDQVPVIPEGGQRAIVTSGKRYVLSWRNWILHMLHNTTSGGHVGSAALEERVKDHCWWPGLGRDCEAWTRRCPQCRAVKGRPLGTTVVRSQRYTAPFRILQIDLITDLRPESEGCMHILSAIDGFTEWLWLVPLDRRSSAAPIIRSRRPWSRALTGPRRRCCRRSWPSSRRTGPASCRWRGGPGTPPRSRPWLA